jgi:hypothetical protein
VEPQHEGSTRLLAAEVSHVLQTLGASNRLLVQLLLLNMLPNAGGNGAAGSVPSPQ